MLGVAANNLKTSDILAGESVRPRPERRFRLPLRLSVLIGVLFVEFVTVSLLPHPSARIILLGPSLIVFCAVLLLLGYRQVAEPMQDDGSYDRVFAGLHVGLFAGFSLLEWMWPRVGFGWTGAATLRDIPWLYFALFLVLLVATLAKAVFATSEHLRILPTAKHVWLYAAIATVIVIPFHGLAQAAWNNHNSGFGALCQQLAFSGSATLLRLFYSDVVMDPTTQMVGTSRFQVEIYGRCSGIEGLGLMLVMTTCWLIYARRELRIWRAVWLVPITMALVWFSNLVRITALIALGDAGYGAVAVDGFHSEAGWILFNLVGFGFLMTANHASWLRKEPHAKVTSSRRNVELVYLLPFVATMVAAMLGRAASSGFDWLYPLRLIVVTAVFAWQWGEYRRGGQAGIDWEFGWLGPMAGVAVFAMWFVLARWQHLDGSALAGQLQALAPWQRLGWIAVRAMVAIVVVPIAEELAFRGYLARRLMSADVEDVPLKSLTVVAIVVSSLVFGAMHGQMWLAGAIAGMVFAYVAKRRNRLGEAVAAHATANLLIAFWVLWSGDFGMW